MARKDSVRIGHLVSWISITLQNISNSRRKHMVVKLILDMNRKMLTVDWAKTII